MKTKILVVDDENDLEVLIRQKFRKQIREGKYEFYFAENGKKALEMMKSEPEISMVLSGCSNIFLMFGRAACDTPDCVPMVAMVCRSWCMAFGRTG